MPSTRNLYRQHKWTGLAVSALLFITCLTGTVSLYQGPLDRWLTPAKRGAPATADALDRVVPALQAQYPGASISGFSCPEDEGGVFTAFVFHRQQLREVFVHPATLAVTGERSGVSVATFLRELHVRFYWFKWPGRVFVGLLALPLLWSTVTGLLLYGPFLRGVTRLGLRFYQLRPGAQLRLSDSHKLAGVLALAFNLILGVTGLVLGLEPLTRFTPALDATLHPRPNTAYGTGPTQLTVSEALARARAALGPFEPTAVVLPSKQTKRFTFYGHPGFLLRRSDSYVAVDAATGAILDLHDARRVAAGVRWFNALEPLHYGNFGGAPLRFCYFLGGLLMTSLTLTGPALWWIKRRHRATITKA